MKENYGKIVRNLLIATLTIWGVTFAAARRDIYTDLLRHTNWAFTLNKSNLFEFMTTYISYPLWHMCVRIWGEFFPLDKLNAASGITALFNCFALWSVMFVWNKLSQVKIEFETVSFYSVCLLLVGPLSLPVFNRRYYLGQGSPNVWHNPTNIAVKGFAILCFVLVVYLLESAKKDKELKLQYIGLSILLFFSALAKPTFLQGFIPGLGLYMVFALIVKGFKQHVKRFIYIVLAFVPAVCIIVFQFICSFYVVNNIAEGGGIGIEFGRVLHRWSPNLAVSLFLAFAFPLIVLLINFKIMIKKVPVQLALFYELAAWGESALFYEKGIREADGNWMWGSFLSMLIVWMVFLISYIEILHDKNVSEKRKKCNLYVGVPLLFAHLLFGISFWYQCSMFYPT